MNVVLVILALSVLVFIHELGHYLVARAFGMRVKVFSIGFGPVLWHWRPKGSETVFQIAAIPVLAYVQIAGMSPAEPYDPDDRGSYQNASPLGRLFTIAAGPLANYLAASVIIFAVLATLGVQRPVIGRVLPDSPAATAGLRTGDVVLRVNSLAPADFGDLAQAINATHGQTFTVTVRREGHPVALRVTAHQDPRDQRFRIGVGQGTGDASERIAMSEVVKHTLLAPARLTVEQVKAIGRMIRGRERVNVMGPVGIVHETAKLAAYGWRHAFDAFAVISLALFFFNLLPVPALDGGRMMFLGYELVLRRKPSPKLEERATQYSMVLLLGLSAVVIVRDIAHIAFG